MSENVQVPRDKRKQDRRMRRISTLVPKLNTTEAQNSGALAVLTSGGDSQGMNAAVRAVVRIALSSNVDVYAVHEGFMGLIEGGDYIKKMNWESVNGIMAHGGTKIGSVRCAEFRKPEGRYAATVNLVKKNVSTLIVIGGDGSLTGADILDQEWSQNVQKAIENNDITGDFENNKQLKVFGLVGSIDNDFADYTMTIGTDSALSRICESIDSIRDTAKSHRRAFVVEVMGRNCGYLALTAAVCSNADYVFLPENVGPVAWREDMIARINRDLKFGKRTVIAIVAEGAVDTEGKAIKCEHIRKILADDMGLDTRITVLGHVQRGGRPSAFDRISATRLGADAAVSAMQDEYTGSRIISISSNTTISLPMMESVARTTEMHAMMKNKEYKKLVELRGKYFKNYLKLYDASKTYIDESKISPEFKGKTVGIIHIGKPTPGMNRVLSSVATLLLNNGIQVKGIKMGIQGLKASLYNNELIINIDHKKCFEIESLAGSMLGNKIDRSKLNWNEEDFVDISNALKTHKIDGLIIMGGRKCLERCSDLHSKKQKFDGINIPIIMVPCSIHNDLPKSMVTIGHDTCINEISHLVYNLSEANQGRGKILNFVEVNGKISGRLATMSALASGAQKCYIPQMKFTLPEIVKDVKEFLDKFEGSISGLIICSEGIDCNNSIDIDALMKIYEKQSAGTVKCVKYVLKDLQIGSYPCVYDRKLAVKFGLKAGEEILKSFKNKSPKIIETLMVGQDGEGLFASSVDDVLDNSMQTNAWKYFNRLTSILGVKNSKITYDSHIEDRLVNR